MFNLIFVDDEHIIRTGISRCINWESNGFKLVGVFENGQQAYDYIKENPVDVVISDINMPCMDGLTLSRLLSKEFPKIMILLLSGYDDFEYAQKAVKNHVREFLLKPITAVELKEALTLVNTELILNRENETKQEEMRENLNTIFPILKERFLNRLITGRLTSDNYARRKDYFKWDDREQFYQVSIIKIQESWTELERLTYIKDIKEQLSTIDEVFSNIDEDIIILFQGEEKNEFETNIKYILDQIFVQVSTSSLEQVSIGCGEIVNSSNSISSSYSGAMTAVNYNIVLGVSQILFIENVRDSNRIVPETFLEMLNTVIENLKECKKEDTVKSMKELFHYMEQHFISPDEAFSYYSRIHHTLYLFTQEMGLSEIEDFFNNMSLNRYKSIAYAQDGFLEYIETIETQICKRRNDILLSRIDKAKEFISLRYQDFSLSLQDICNELYLSTSQFSFLFKDGTGQTFVEYLTIFRIEEAKKLLKMTNQKVYEIAENVGYQDPRYFSIIFKKITGSTALEYRKRLED